MKMICFLIEIVAESMFLNVVKSSNFDNIETLLHDITESSSVGDTSCTLLLFLILWLSVPLLHKLDFEDSAIPIINVGKTVAAPRFLLFVNVSKVVVISG